MASERWKHSNTTVYNIGYHLIWCPKYRRNVLVGGIEGRLKELIFEKCGELRVKVESLEIMPDHVHLFVKCPPIASPHWVVQQIKGYSSRVLRKEFKELRTKLPTLWTRSYYVESVGHISEKTIKRYIQEQKGQ